VSAIIGPIAHERRLEVDARSFPSGDGSVVIPDIRRNDPKASISFAPLFHESSRKSSFAAQGLIGVERKLRRSRHGTT
jgi:hypothetical protein